MAKSSLDKAKQKVPLEVEWKAFELRPGGSLPEPGYMTMIQSRWPQTIEMGRQYGVEMKSHSFGINTRPAHQALKIIERMAPQQAEAYNAAVFRAYFEDDEDIGEIDVLVRLANTLGIDGYMLRERLLADEALEEVLQEEQSAFQNGISGVPAFIFKDKYLLSGVCPPEQIERIVHQVREREGESKD